MYEERVYRDLFKGVNLKFFDVCIEETDLMIGATKELYNEALLLVKKYRSTLKDYIKENPEFLTSLVPLEPANNAPYIVKRMCDSTAQAGVGPMAAVAGAVSELVGLELLKFSDEIIVENGGDIFIKTNSKRKVGIYAGKSPLSEKIAIEIVPERTPMGICTSSGTVGHSLSFGKADAAVIMARDTFLSDAVATATGNRVKEAGDIESAIEFASGIKGVEGVLIIVGDKIGAWGDIKLTSF
ncbi:UPF0280 family protein [Acetivibrio cellulolyticus]|uniref:UPF0280 family protein n=1 Tax=Acetivibrio cellulolyticus TaxID=35830 RepID=UPI0001E2E745|nr:UPF0280 family protein [Acetivibrio cellulolyticus]